MTHTTLSNTAERLMQLPKEIESLQYSILKKMTSSTIIAASASSIESKIRLEISSEVDANGKKVYSNAETRGAEFEERAQFNSELLAIREEYDAIQRQIQEMKIQVETLNNEQRNIRSVLHFFAGSNDQL